MSDLPKTAGKKPFLISFSGIDGAGKSTQISRLYSHLEDSGLRVKLITFWDDVVQLKSFREKAAHKAFRGDEGVGSPDTPIVRRDKNVKSPLLTVARMGFYFLDALALRRIVESTVHASPETRPDAVIFDRYIYDEMANLDLANPLASAYLQLMLLFIPKPDIAFVLDADPDAAFLRKPEYPLEFLHSNRNAYLGLSRRIKGISVIAPQTIDSASDEILRQVTAKRETPHPISGVAGRLVQQ